MVEIKEKQELNVKKLLSFRGKVTQAELEAISKEMQEIIAAQGARQLGNAITATFAVEGNLIEIEVLVPIDKPVSNIGNYTYKEQLFITNAVVAMYKGHPNGLQGAIEKLNQYMSDNMLQSITVGYSVTRKIDMLTPENSEIEVYVGVNPNIL